MMLKSLCVDIAKFNVAFVEYFIIVLDGWNVSFISTNILLATLVNMLVEKDK